MKKLALVFLCCALLGPGLWADGKMIGTDYDDDNSLSIHTGEDGVINFTQADFFPGPGFEEKLSMDIAPRATDIHGLGVVTSESIIQKGPSNYIVKGFGKIVPVEVSIEQGAITLGLGLESYRISHKGDYLVEVRPRGKDGKPDPSQRFAYRITPNKDKDALSIIDRSYVPKDTTWMRGADYDIEAIFYPGKLIMKKGSLEADTYALRDTSSPTAGYKIMMPLSFEKSVNLMNYLILLTQRWNNDGYKPLTNPVILTIYYFDSLAQ
jgi:hypothetical protein